MNRLHTSSQDDHRHQESKLRSIAIADDNARQATSRREAKAHEKLDDIIRNDYATQLHKLDLVNEKQHEQEKLDRGAEYGESLRKQIGDNERRRHAESHPTQNTTAFCEAFVDLTEQNRAKILKQTEYREDLDECVRRKKEIKDNIKTQELADDKRRNDFSKKHHDNYVEFNENTYEQSDRSQQQRDGVSAMWRTENDFNIAKQDKHMDMNADDVNFEDDDSKSMDVVEVQRRITARKALLQQLQEKIEASYRRFEEEKRARAQLLLEIQREEYRLRQLHEKEQRKYSEYEKNVPGNTNGVEHLEEHMSRATVDENDSSHSKFY